MRLEHDPGNVIDLGLLDGRAGAFPSSEGFRGWSGGARDRFFIAMDDATPGYLPGKMPPGNWQLVLGLYQILPHGCRYFVAIELDDAPRTPIADADEQPFFPVPPGWYPGDLQSHTHHSDARGSLSDLVNAAKHRGLRFLAVTDHNTVSHHRQLPRMSSSELFLLPGEEVTTAAGHANVWGAADWVDFRITAPAHVDAVAERAHALGGVISINHPKPGGPDWQYHVPMEADCVEAWQAPWPAGNDVSLEFYDRLLREGRRVVLVGGSDRHQPGWPDHDPEILQVGSPTTWLWLDELSVRACLAALKSGRVFVSEGPAGPRLELAVNGVPMGGTVGTEVVTKEPGASDPQLEAVRSSGMAVASIGSRLPVLLRLMGELGEIYTQQIPVGEHEVEVELDLTRAGKFVRAELWHETDDRIVALSNPLFFN